MNLTTPRAASVARKPPPENAIENAGSTSGAGGRAGLGSRSTQGWIRSLGAVPIAGESSGDGSGTSASPITRGVKWSGLVPPARTGISPVTEIQGHRLDPRPVHPVAPPLGGATPVARGAPVAQRDYGASTIKGVEHTRRILRPSIRRCPSHGSRPVRSRHRGNRRNPVGQLGPSRSRPRSRVVRGPRHNPGW